MEKRARKRMYGMLLLQWCGERVRGVNGLSPPLTAMLMFKKGSDLQ